MTRRSTSIISASFRYRIANNFLLGLQRVQYTMRKIRYTQKHTNVNHVHFTIQMRIGKAPMIHEQERKRRTYRNDRHVMKSEKLYYWLKSRVNVFSINHFSQVYILLINILLLFVFKLFFNCRKALYTQLKIDNIFN